MYKKNKSYTDEILLSYENLKVERKLEKHEFENMQILQKELLYLQHKKNALENELKTVNKIFCINLIIQKLFLD